MDGSSLASPEFSDPAHAAPAWAGPQILARLLGISSLQQVYAGLPPTRSPGDFAAAALAALGITLQVTGEPLAGLPASGPLLLVANHPFGGVEGLAVAAQCGRIRPDLKILANSALFCLPELRPMLIPVDVQGREVAGNVSGLRAALRHLEAGGALAVFPSGVVAHWQRALKRVADPAWHAFAGRLARSPGTQVVPLFFAGRNSCLFQLAGCLHPVLRTLLLPRELLRLRGRSVGMVVGRPVKPGLLASLAHDAARTAHLRARCEIMGRTGRSRTKTWPVPVAEREDAAALLAEVTALPAAACLVAEKGYAVYAVQGKAAPHLVREIGRLRELSFRQLDEGSGQARDLDRYDPDYTHIILWDTRQSVLAGGYRVRLFFAAEYSGGGTPGEEAPGNEAPGNEAFRGGTSRADASLYSASLFRFRPAFFEGGGVCMELGRAFVAPDYQRDYAPLMLLWKGIAGLAATAGVRRLFGPSSISLAYAPESIHLLRQHLSDQHWDAGLAATVRGRRDPKEGAFANLPDVRGLEYKVCNSVVKDLEGDKALPVLFKHYLQLGGRIAAFHEDRRFGTLDALLVVDLTRTPDKTLLHYLTPARLELLRDKQRSL